jgi:HK97 family phage major capsid protein
MFSALSTQGTAGTYGGAITATGGFLTLGAATAVNFASGASTELASNTISLDSAAQMMVALDAAYLASPNCAWYFTPVQWAGILRQVSSTDKKSQLVANEAGARTLYSIPVVLTSQTLTATASTVGGPILGDLSKAMTLRTVPSQFQLLRSTERYAEKAQTYFRAVLRADVATRDPRAAVTVKYAAS